MTRYYTSGDIAKLCGVARSTASNWIARGNIELAEIVTVGGTSIWTEEQALRIQASYLAKLETLATIAALKSEIARLKESS